MKKKILIGLGIFVGVIFIFMVWYKYTYSMDKIKGYEVNAPTNKTHVLIATQGSEYKNKLVDGIIQSIKEQPVYIKVIDVSGLNEINTSNWQAIILLHTWEIWKPESHSKEFLNKHYDKNKMYVMATSGSGEEMIEGIDGISGASDLNSLDNDLTNILNWLEPLIR